MGKIAIPERKCFPVSQYGCGTGIIDTHTVAALVFGQYFVDNDRDKFAGFVPEPEFHWCDFSICIGTGNHLHRNVNAQYAFHLYTPFMDMPHIHYKIRTYVCKQVDFGIDLFYGDLVWCKRKADWVKRTSFPNLSARIYQNFKGFEIVKFYGIIIIETLSEVFHEADGLTEEKLIRKVQGGIKDD